MCSYYPRIDNLGLVSEKGDSGRNVNTEVTSFEGCVPFKSLRFGNQTKENRLTHEGITP